MEVDLYFGEKVDLLSFQIHLCIVQPLPGTLPYQYVEFFFHVSQKTFNASGTNSSSESRFIKSFPRAFLKPRFLAVCTPPFSFLIYSTGCFVVCINCSTTLSVLSVDPSFTMIYSQSEKTWFSIDRIVLNSVSFRLYVGVKTVIFTSLFSSQYLFLYCSIFVFPKKIAILLICAHLLIIFRIFCYTFARKEQAA